MNAGDTAWLLVSAALVLLMTPALALFYGGMVRKKNVLSTIMHSLSAIPLVTVMWVTVGYSLAFGKSHYGLIGGFEFIGLRGLDTALHGTVPTLAYSPSCTGTRKTRSSSPTSTVSVTDMLGKTMLSSRGISKRFDTGLLRSK